MDILKGLNPEQRLAVTLPHRSALILAGAGSGKTRVLTTRIAYLISTGAVSPQNILAVTFTNKAAREMLTRLTAMLPINTRGMWIGTFHGLCNRMLRAHHREANLPQTFQILDSGDQLSAIKRVMKAMNVDDEKYPPREMQFFISGNKEQGLRAHEVEAYDPYTRRKMEIFAEYDAQCQREGVVDFAELMLRSHELPLHDRLNTAELACGEQWSYVPHLTIVKLADESRLDAVLELSRQRWAAYRGSRRARVAELTFVREGEGNRWVDLAPVQLGGPSSQPRD